MKFLEWFRDNQTNITWWLIGWLTFASIDCIVKHDYVMAAVNAGLIYFNYTIWKRR